MKKVILILLSVALLLTLFSGCSSSKDSGDSEKAGTVGGEVEGTPAEEDFNETSVLNLVWGGSAGDDIFESPWRDNQCLMWDMVSDTLIKYDVGGNSFVNRLATDWSMSDDALEYTFKIREDATWHDGEPVTAEDVVFSFNAMFRDPHAVFKQNYTSIEGSNAVIEGEADLVSGIELNDNVVTFKLSSPNSLFTHHLCRMVILPKHLLGDVEADKVSIDETFWTKPILCGPYKIDQVSFANYCTAVPYEGYYGSQPAIKNVTFTSYRVGGAEAEAAAFIAGELDYRNTSSGANDIAFANNVVSQNPDLTYDLIPSTYYREFQFNTVGSTDGKYNDDMQKKEVRQAINLLLDKEALANFYEGQGLALSTGVSPLSDEYNADIPLFKRDIGKAKELLKGANFDFDRTVRIVYYYDDQKTTDFMELVKQNLADGGIKADATLLTGDLDAAIDVQRNWDILYAGSATSSFFENYAYLLPGSIYDNYFGDTEYRNETFRPLWNGYLEAKNNEEMKYYLDKLQAEALDYCIDIPVYTLSRVAIYNKNKLFFDPEWHEHREYALNFGDWGFDQWRLMK